MIKIDCIGEFCPIPLMKVRKHYREIESGDSLTVLTDHICVVESVGDFVADANGSIDVEELETGSWQLTINKS